MTGILSYFSSFRFFLSFFLLFFNNIDSQDVVLLSHVRNDKIKRNNIRQQPLTNNSISILHCGIFIIIVNLNKFYLHKWLLKNYCQHYFLLLLHSLSM